MLNDKKIKMLLREFFKNKSLFYDILDSLEVSLVEQGILCIPTSTIKIVLDSLVLTRKDVNAYISDLDISVSDNQIHTNTLSHIPKPLGGSVQLKHTFFIDEISCNKNNPVIHLKYMESLHLDSLPKRLFLKGILGKSTLLSYILKKQNLSFVTADNHCIHLDLSSGVKGFPVLDFLSLGIEGCTNDYICLNFDFLEGSSDEETEHHKRPAKKVQGGFLRNMLNNSDRF